MGEERTMVFLELGLDDFGGYKIFKIIEGSVGGVLMLLIKAF